MTDVSEAPLECGCTSDHSCEHHTRLRAYALALRGEAADRDLPDLVLRPTYGTWWAQMGIPRRVLLAAFVVAAPVYIGVRTSPLAGVAAFAVFAVPITVALLLIMNQRLTVSPRDRAVHFRSWRLATTRIPVDDDTRGAAFLYASPVGLDLQVVVWSPVGHARLLKTQWGSQQLEDVVVVLGISPGGIADDAELEAMFPGITSPLNKHPALFAVGLIGTIFALVVAAAYLFGGDDGADDTAPAEPSVTEVNGPKPEALPRSVESAQEELDASLRTLFGEQRWTSESTIRPCNEQPGWQRETTQRTTEEPLVATGDPVAGFTAAVEAQGLVVDETRLGDTQITIDTEYGSPTGSGARMDVYSDAGGPDSFYGASVVTQSQCVITR